MKEDYDFPMIPATEKSIKRRRLICGVGFNDADYHTNGVCNGTKTKCPYYSKWKDMIERGYSPRLKRKYPTYKEVTVCEEWKTFSNFKKWMEKRDWKGKCLDKDLIHPNNKIYSPDTCVFVEESLNNLLTDRRSKRGLYRKGVHRTAKGDGFIASCSENGKQKFLGLFPTESQAYEAYVHYKHALILKVANEQEDIRVKNGLILHANILLESLNDENETLL